MYQKVTHIPSAKWTVERVLNLVVDLSKFLNIKENTLSKAVHFATYTGFSRNGL